MFTIKNRKILFWLHVLNISLSGFVSFFVEKLFNREPLSDNQKTYFIFVVLIIIYLFITEYKSKEYSKSIEKELQDIKNINKDLFLVILSFTQAHTGNFGKILADYFNKRIKSFGNKMGFGNQIEKNDRITLYYYDGIHFRVLTRHSLNPELKKIDADKTYPQNKGAIARGFRNVFYATKKNEIPDRNKNQADYEKCLKDDFQFTEEDIKGISMHCRYFAVQQITLEHSEKNKWYALIIIESLQTDRYKEKLIKETLNDLSEEISPMLKIWFRRWSKNAAKNAKTMKIAPASDADN